MDRDSFSTLVAAVGLLVAAVPVRAHHSMSEFDKAKSITLRGVVTSVKWENPHCFIYVDVTDGTGKVVNWGFEGSGPAALIRHGMNASLLKPGAEVTVKTNPARDTTKNFGFLNEMAFADGQTYRSETNIDQGPR
jgi:hypothetical protein